jgi:N-acetylglutamate synthase
MQRYRSAFMQRDLVHELDALSARALPALETLDLDGWRLRSARGFTKRANSVWLRETGTRVPLERKLEHVERFYAVRRLPACYQLGAGAPAGLDRLLGRRGYGLVAPTDVRAATLSSLIAPDPAGTDPSAVGVGHLTARPTPRWLDAWGALRGTADRRDVAEAVYGRVAAPSAYLLLEVEGVDVAVLRGVLDGGWLGLFDLAVHPEARRRRVASTLLRSLGRWAAERDGVQAWAQVEQDNPAAQQLFTRLGFRTISSYRYRIRPA